MEKPGNTSDNTNQPTCVTVDEFVDHAKEECGDDYPTSLTLDFIMTLYPKGLKIIPNKQGDGDE